MFKNLSRIFFQDIRVCAKSQNFREDYVTPELKERSRELGSPLNSYCDRCLKFSYTYISAIPAVTTARGSWLATFVRYRKSWFSIIVKSQECNLDTPLVIRRNCNEASGRMRPVCVRAVCVCVCVCARARARARMRV